MSAELEQIFDRVVAIDHARPLVERTEQVTRSATCILADVHFLPFADHCADFVVCTEVLEHVVIPTQVLLEIRRVLKADGIAFITVPNEVGLNPFVVARPNAPRMDTHINYYNSKSLCRMLLSCGFQVIEMETWSPSLGFGGWLRNPLGGLRHLVTKLPAFGLRIECLAKPAEDPMACWQQLISQFSEPDR